MEFVNHRFAGSKMNTDKQDVQDTIGTKNVSCIFCLSAFTKKPADRGRRVQPWRAGLFVPGILVLFVAYSSTQHRASQRANGGAFRGLTALVVADYTSQ